MSQQHGSAPDESVTLINIFEVPAEQVEGFIAQWRERAQLMSTLPGFRSFRLHRAISPETRFQLVNVAEWDSPGAWKAAIANPEFQDRMRALDEDASVQVRANPALYRTVVEHRD